MQQVFIWKISTLFLFGLVVGMAILYSKSGTGIPDRDPGVTEINMPSIDLPGPDLGSLDQADQAVESARLDFAGSLMQEGDHYLKVGNPALALEKYLGFSQTTAQRNAALLLRIAAAYEEQQDLPRAETFYREAQAVSNSHNHVALSVVGVARVLIYQNRIAEAIDILSDHLLTIEYGNAVPDQTRAMVNYQWARTLEAATWPQPPRAEALPTNRTGLISRGELDLTRPGVITNESTLPDQQQLLGLIDFPVPDRPLDLTTQNRLDIELLQRPDVFADTIAIRVDTGLQPVAAILKKLSAVTELQLQLTPAANKILAGRSRQLNYQSATVSTLLDQLLIPFELQWRQQGQQIDIGNRSDFSESETNSFRFFAAERALRRFEIDFPETEFRKASLLTRAGLALRSGNYDTAANLYQELQQAHPNGETLARLFFNLGKLSLLLERPKQAETFLYHAVDQTLNPDIESSSYCLLSGIHLSDAELDEAIKTARRGLALAVSVEQKCLAAMNLSRAYLLNRDPFSANDSLFRNREYLEGSPDQKLAAAMLGTYSRAVGTQKESTVRREHERLLTILGAMQPKDFSSFADYYIAAMSFEFLGFDERALVMMMGALTSPDTGQWRPRILLETTRLQETLGRPQDALETLGKLRLQGNDEAEKELWNTRALLDTARIQLGMNRFRDCIESCRQLSVVQLDEEQKRTLLELLGKAYSGLGEHYAAALCYSGYLPDEL